MKRVNIYIPETQDSTLDALAKILNKSKAEITRLAIDEYVKQYKSELDSFKSGIKEDVDNPNLEFVTKCASDPIFFIENCIKILNNQNEMTNFILYDYQKNLIQSAHSDNIIVNKCRQIGFTKIMCAYIVHYAMFNKGKIIAIAGPKYQWAKEMLRIIRIMIDNLPSEIKLKTVHSSVEKIELNENRIMLLNMAGAEFNIKGLKPDFIFLDEAAYMEKAKLAIYLNLLLHTKKIIIGSTKKPEYNIFYKLWTDALANYNNLKPIRVPYYVINGRDEKWKEEQIKLMGEKNFKNEYECKWED